jgi:hypothetical protein
MVSSPLSGLMIFQQLRQKLVPERAGRFHIVVPAIVRRVPIFLLHSFADAASNARTLGHRS